MSRPIKVVSVTLVCIAVMHSALLTIAGIKKLTQQRFQMSAAMAEINRRLDAHPDLIVICSFRCALPQYALHMALIYAPAIIRESTIKKLTNFYEFDIFTSRFVTAGQESKASDWPKTGIVLNKEILLIKPLLYAPIKHFTSTSFF